MRNRKLADTAVGSKAPQYVGSKAPLLFFILTLTKRCQVQAQGLHGVQAKL